MCGRFVIARATSELVVEFKVTRPTEEEIAPSYNVAPTDRIPIVVDAGGERRLELARWGLVPRWAADEKVGVRAINARSETAAEKPTFRDAVRSRRAVIPADGYYEWQKHADGSKTPFYIRTPEALTLFAGLYEWWRDPAGGWLLSTSILTRAAAGERMREIHDRMPILLDRGDVDEWLAPGAGDANLLADFADRAEAVSTRLRMHAVDPRVGRVRENDPALILPSA
ncbi:SOS response-associated peptidase [Gulosibacter sp. 10]|uniref:SOS response-associated peptidase n=1 Tax=Gulosibacter sp. 10 TaxID=1255570 RepID=UPI00097F2F4D|nr:SOS response-associated peptidase [Gulosibacter sp. 10]SJM63960.1 protein of unknown function DUF159 [Gulosibacter sp. 10]